MTTHCLPDMSMNRTRQFVKPAISIAKQAIGTALQLSPLSINIFLVTIHRIDEPVSQSSQATADVQSVLLVLHCMSKDVL